MTGPGLPAYGAVYGYYDNNGNKADLVSTLDFRSDESTTLLRNTRAYDSQRDLVD